MSEDSFIQIANYSFDNKTVNSLKKQYLQVYKGLNEMRLEDQFLLFSDIHGNPPCLELTLNFSKQNNINKIISLGDLVDYNSKGNEVVKIVTSTKNIIISLAGNHENKERFSFLKSVFDPKYENEFDLETMDYILDLQEGQIISVFDKKFLLMHCNPWNLENMFIMPKDIEAKKYFLNYIPFDGFMYGHTHYLDHYQKDRKLIMNPGSLGCAIQGYVSFAWILPKENSITYYKIDVDGEHPLQVLSEEPILIKTEKYQFY